MKPADNSSLALKQQAMSLPPGQVRRRADFKRRVGCYGCLLGLAGLVAAILFPVFVQQHLHSRGSCVSSEKQIGLALLQYAQDYDECLPCGARGNRRADAIVRDTRVQAKYHAGQAWAGGLSPYVQNPRAYFCPQARDQMRDNALPLTRNVNAGKELILLTPVTYAYNRNAALNTALYDYNAAERTALLAEVTGVYVNLHDGDEHNPENTYSPAGNGLSVLASTDGATQSEAAGGARYVTGIPGGYGHTPGCVYWPFYAPQSPSRHEYGAPPHEGGSLYLMADGHARFFKPGEVSPGDDATDAKTEQNCSRHSAAGTSQMQSFAVTFSTR